jgi:uncharacterized RDD family membrane protein YckC
MTSTNKYNTFGKRLLAGLVDSFIFIPFFFLENWVEHTDSKTIFVGWAIFHTTCWTLYVVICHGKFGQTIGKKLMGIKIFALNEKDLIGYKNAFLRESVWFFAVIAGIVYFLISTSNNAVIDEESKSYYDEFVSITSGIWLILELITMFFNQKRRALHDFLAGSIVIDLIELQREDLHRRQQELVTSLQH